MGCCKNLGYRGHPFWLCRRPLKIIVWSCSVILPDLVAIDLTVTVPNSGSEKIRVLGAWLVVSSTPCLHISISTVTLPGFEFYLEKWVRFCNVATFCQWS